MKFRVSTAAALASARGIAAIARPISRRAQQFYRACKHRRDLAVLAELDDRMLADIGLTRSDLSEAIGQPWWRAPTAALPRRAAAAPLNEMGSKIKRWWLGGDKNRRALAALDDDQLCNLSEIGLQVRREARRERATAS
jgi:uncharacterized protein YjiS (DUF1127 family)